MTVNFTYDLLNRIKTKSYSDSTPAVTYCYDALPSSPGVCATSAAIGFTGRLTDVYSSASRTDYLTFDNLGRVKSSQQVTGTVAPGVFNYTYTPQGALGSVQYPSGRTITYSFDAVAGRVTSVAGASVNYATSIAYWANGSIQQMKLGNPLTEQTCLNSRMEPLATRLGAAATTNCANSSDTLNLSYTYAASDNGNVQSQSIQRPGFSAVQNYTVSPYDGVNRLKGAQETGPGTSWTENYSYDAFGNRWVTSGAPTLETPVAQSWYSATNRINTWGYDGSGNVTSVASMQRSFAYDAENRQQSATVNGQTATYVYDGDGRRVQKVSGGATTTYVYDAQGQLAAEYGPVTDSGTRYVTADHLGSTRVLTDASGNVVKCYDYYPFGGEIAAGVDGRPGCYSSGVYPASPDVASEKFTGKERDAESGLDFFGARYTSTAQGRLTSPDPISSTLLHMLNPQRWNMYSYAINNPLAYLDPDGRAAISVKFGNLAHGLGHAGIAYVNDDGEGTFADFGPQHPGSAYDTGKYTFYDITIVYGPDHKPTQSSLTALANKLADDEQQPRDSVSVAYYKTSDAETASLEQYIKAARAQQGQGTQPHYWVGFRDCSWFCQNGLARVGKYHGTSILSIPNLQFLGFWLFADQVATGTKTDPEADRKPPHDRQLVPRWCLENRTCDQ